MSATRREEQDAVIARALEILEGRMPGERFQINSPGSIHQYARLHLAQAERELFLVVFLDAQHRVIAKEELFLGTLTECVVFPREVARAALRHNAGAVVLIHNHPSGGARSGRRG